MILYTSIQQSTTKVKIWNNVPIIKPFKRSFVGPTSSTYNIVNIKLFPNKEWRDVARVVWLL